MATVPSTAAGSGLGIAAAVTPERIPGMLKKNMARVDVINFMMLMSEED